MRTEARLVNAIELAGLAIEVARICPGAELVKNEMGNLAIVRGEYVGYIDLTSCEVIWYIDPEEFRDLSR
jgi:hypothetical protein